MAARVPIVAERSPLVAHYVPDGITGRAAAAGGSERHRVDGGLVPRRTATSARRWVAPAARGPQRDFKEEAMIDGFAAAANAAGDRATWAKR